MIICIDYPLNIMKYNYNKSTDDWIAYAECWNDDTPTM